MNNNIFIERGFGTPTFEKKFEFVERKGIGHPDTICDLVVEKISSELSKLYIKETGFVQHHNMDKAMLVAGQSENKFGGGKITKPMKMILGDRATFSFNAKDLPIVETSVKAARSWFEENFRFVKDEHLEFQIEMGSGSKELQSVCKPKSFLANDTSVLVGYAPATELETVVLQTEQFINSKNFKKEFPQSGEDVKVLAFRNGNHVDLTIAIAFVDRFVESEESYFKSKKEMNDKISEFLSKKTDLSIESRINGLDSKGIGMDGLYLTVLGTSADNADSGEVGRGNMANRVISPSRPAGAEATAGKNPVSHIGKIYNVLSFQIAEDIHNEIPGISEVFVWMYNVIGRPVKNPKSVVIQPILKENTKLDAIDEEKIREIVNKKLENIDKFCDDLITRKENIV